MDFQDFLALVPKIVKEPLPAHEAHLKMAPIERIRFHENFNTERLNPKIAAVMMLLYPKKQKTHLALLLRNAYPGIHSSQIALPGGKYELVDQNYETTALRETQEEIGVHPNKMKIIMPFSSLYIPPSNFKVYPFLGVCNEEIVFVPNPSEVAEIIELPLRMLLEDDLIVQTEMKTSDANSISIPAFKINKHIVWGATAMMLSELKEVLKNSL